MRKNHDTDHRKEISHGSEPDICSEGVVIISVKEHIKAEGATLPQKSRMLDLRNGHIVFPLSYF